MMRPIIVVAINRYDGDETILSAVSIRPKARTLSGCAVVVVCLFALSVADVMIVVSMHTSIQIMFTWGVA